MAIKVKISKPFLVKEYLKNKRSYKDISIEIGCGQETIRNRLIKFGIDRRSRTFRSEKGKKKLSTIFKELYKEKDKNGKSINGPFYGKHHTKKAKEQISKAHKGKKKIGGFIPSFLGRKHKKSTKLQMSKTKVKKLDVNYIIKKYIINEKSCREIGNKLKVSDGTIRNRLINNGIKLRRHHTKKVRARISFVNKIKKPYKRTENYKKLMSEIKTKNWQDLKYAKKVLKRLSQKPSSYEKKIADLCINNNLPFIYSGDGTFLIGSKNPDFVNKKDKLVIEVFNDYHKIVNYESVENYILERTNYFKRYGYKCIFIRQKNVINKNWEKICLNKINLGLKNAK